MRARRRGRDRRGSAPRRSARRTQAARSRRRRKAGLPGSRSLPCPQSALDPQSDIEQPCIVVAASDQLDADRQPVRPRAGRQCQARHVKHGPQRVEHRRAGRAAAPSAPAPAPAGSGSRRTRRPTRSPRRGPRRRGAMRCGNRRGSARAPRRSCRRSDRRSATTRGGAAPAHGRAAPRRNCGAAASRKYRRRRTAIRSRRSPPRRRAAVAAASSSTARPSGSARSQCIVRHSARRGGRSGIRGASYGIAISAARNSAVSSTERAIVPTVSRLSVFGCMPAGGNRP